MTVLPLHFPTSRRQSWIKAIETHLIRLCDRLVDGLARGRQRRDLLALSDSALKDFAASRADVAR
jgi:uncharacterized protein YjiS (DUF1127 family)